MKKYRRHGEREDREMQYSVFEIAKPILEAMSKGVPGYEGICRECLHPVKHGEGYRLREGGYLFHLRCVDQRPNGYYIRLERRRAERMRSGQ